MKTKLLATASWIGLLISVTSEYGLGEDFPLTPAVWLAIAVCALVLATAQPALNRRFQGNNVWTASRQPSGDGPSLANADAHFNLGVVYANEGRFEDAVSAFRMALKYQPDFAHAWGGLVKAYLNLRQTDKAGEAAREMKRIDPVKANQLADELSREVLPPPAPQAKSA